MKITFPGFMFYWKGALGGLDSHGPQQEDSENIGRRVTFGCDKVLGDGWMLLTLAPPRAGRYGDAHTL